MKKSKITLLLLPALAFIVGYMFLTVYGEVKRRTINEFNNQQMILARQAARGIESFFSHYRHGLTFLSRLDDIIAMDD